MLENDEVVCRVENELGFIHKVLKTPGKLDFLWLMRDKSCITLLDYTENCFPLSKLCCRSSLSLSLTLMHILMVQD